MKCAENVNKHFTARTFGSFFSTCSCCVVIPLWMSFVSIQKKKKKKIFKIHRIWTCKSAEITIECNRQTKMKISFSLLPKNTLTHIDVAHTMHFDVSILSIFPLFFEYALFNHHSTWNWNSTDGGRKKNK